MKTRTWKIGEYAKGGVITVEIRGKVIAIIGKDWDFSQGSNRGSSQKNAKEFTRGTCLSTDNDAYRKCDNFLNDLTTSYYAGEIMKWVESKIKFEPENWW